MDNVKWENELRRMARAQCIVMLLLFLCSFIWFFSFFVVFVYCFCCWIFLAERWERRWKKGAQKNKSKHPSTETIKGQISVNRSSFTFCVLISLRWSAWFSDKMYVILNRANQRKDKKKKIVTIWIGLGWNAVCQINRQHWQSHSFILSLSASVSLSIWLIQFESIAIGFLENEHILRNIRLKRCKFIAFCWIRAKRAKQFTIKKRQSHFQRRMEMYSFRKNMKWPTRTASITPI